MKRSVYLSKAAVSLKTIVCDDATRLNINQLHVTPDYTEAANGHILLRVPHMPEPPPDMQMSEGEEISAEGILVDPEQAEAALKNAEKKQEYVCVSKQLGGKIRTESQNTKRSARFEQEELDAQFPYVDMILPKREHWAEHYTVTLNSIELKRLVDWAVKFGDGRLPGIRFYVKSPEHPVQVEICQEDGNVATGVIMPVRDDVEIPVRVEDNEEEDQAV
jgi:hypothetical protein